MWKKLGVTEEQRRTFVDEPSTFRAILDLPVEARTDFRAKTDLAVAFVKRAAQLPRMLGAGGRSVFPDGALWIAWPKRASGVPTDVTESVIRDGALERGLVDVKVCAIDETWSGLKLVWRKELRGSGRV